MHEHFGAVEADFQTQYGLDLREVLWGRLRYGARRVWSLVSGLSPTGATARATVYDGRPWSNTDEFLATVIELLDHGNRMYYGAHRPKSGAQVWDPIKVERPWKEAAEQVAGPRKQGTTADMRAVFGDENIVHDYTPGPREGE
jgi:hypothetical protein